MYKLLIFNTIPCRVVSNHIGQGKVKFHAFCDGSTTILLLVLLLSKNKMKKLLLYMFCPRNKDWTDPALMDLSTIFRSI